MYKKERPKVYETVEKAFHEWEKSREIRAKQPKKKFPMVCFSRKIGAGALEIADIVGKKIGYRVIDREMLEHLTDRKHQSRILDALDSERCPGAIEDVISMIFGQKTFAQSEYSHLLFKTIFSIADIGPAIFVGRGAHLILPRDRVFAVRLICSNEFRIKKIAEMLKISENTASLRLNHLDIDQKNFYSRIYDQKDASPYEFDMVINRDYIQDAHQIAEIIKTALIQKFGMVNLGAGSMS
ncbi:MAG: cytidylate kinase-like family protein [Desulfobacteraceae bacterium]|nr:cytidylate kinase-like family protein [Desulfobacteraceae bacterium]MBC2756111.1 cytidylate kinase-like family protein [Desulfobacteraceae bacterium]